MSQEEVSQNEDPSENILSPRTSSVSTSTTSTRRRISKRLPQKQKVIEPDQQHKILKLVAEKLQSQNKYSNYAAYVGQELDALPPMMATYCQKLINDALFNAKCGQLTAQSRIVTGSQTSDIVHSGTNSQQSFNAISTEYSNQSHTWQPPSTSVFYSNFMP